MMAFISLLVAFVRVSEPLVWSALVEFFNKLFGLRTEDT